MIDGANICMLESKIPCKSDTVQEIGIEVDKLKTAIDLVKTDEVTLNISEGKLHLSGGRFTYHLDTLMPQYIRRGSAAKVPWGVIFNVDGAALHEGLVAVLTSYPKKELGSFGVDFYYEKGKGFILYDQEHQRVDAVYKPEELTIKTDSDKPQLTRIPCQYIEDMRTALKGAEVCQVKFLQEAPLAILIKHTGLVVGWVFAPRILKED